MISHEYLGIDAEILVDEDIAESCYLLPRHVGLSGSDVLRKALDRLANHLEITDARVLRLLVPGEVLLRHPFRKRPDESN